MNPMMRARLLTVVMLIMGIVLVVGSTMSILATAIFPFDGLAGTDVSVAGVAFGVGIAIASFNPEKQVMWVRMAILYTILVVVYRIVFGIFWGQFGQPAALILAVLFGIAMVVLYPRKSELMPHAGSVADESPTAHAASS